MIEFPESVVILALDGAQLVLVRQMRPGANEPMVELPAGKIEPGETPLQAASRELAEECGLAATTWTELGAFYAAAAYSTEFVRAFSASGLVEVGEPELEVIRRTPEQALAEINDAGSLASIALWRAHG